MSKKVTIIIRRQLSSRVHLTWTFHLLPHSDTKAIIGLFARTGLFYHSTTKSLLSVINEKDVHIKALQEKLSDLGGSYFPRKHRDALDSFNEDKWRDERRKQVSLGKESAWEVFERWGELGEDEVMDWEAVVAGLGMSSPEDVDVTVCLRMMLLLIIGN